MSHTFHRYKVGDEPVPGYRLMDHLGAGGFGEVWKATAPGGTEVALKIIDLTGQQGVQEFASLRVVKKVRHPNLISLQAFWMKDEEGQIVDEAGGTGAAKPVDVTVTAPLPSAGEQAESANIAMTTRFARPVELIIAMQLGSMSLHKRLEECRAQSLPGVPVAELLEYLEQAARGIDFLNKPIHDLGKGPMPIVHGDIKPHNILVVGDAAVVCDFGLARAVETLRKTSMAPVTVAYAAPESFKGKVTPTSDQYSLAITYAELRTGRLPFDETLTPYQVMEAHVTRNLDFSRLPEPEQAVIYRGTEANPEDRWPSSRDLILALRQAVAQTGELPLRPGELAYTGGPTPSHALTGRPMARETGRPTQIPIDPHKETMHPGGRTPSHMPSRLTAASPEEYQAGGALAETAIVGPDGTVIIPTPKRSYGLWVAMTVLTLAVAALAAAVILPKISEKPVASVSPAPVQQSNAASNAGGKSDAPEPAPTDANGQYIKLVRDKINAGDFAAAVDLLDKAPSKLPEFEKEALQKRLRAAFLESIDSLVRRRSFGLALVQLEDASSGIGLSNDDKQKQHDRIRAAWLDQAREELKNEDFSKAIETAGSMLKRFPGDRDAQLVIARGNVRLGDNAAAIAALNDLGKAGAVLPEYQPLQAGLMLLATGAESAKSGDQLKLLDGLLSLAAMEKAAPPPAALAINTWERDRLTALRTRVVESVKQSLDTLPADQRKAVLAKLEQLGSSADLEMYKVKSLLDDKQFGEARKALAALAAKAPKDNSDLRNENRATLWLIDLSDPAAKPADAAKAMTDAAASVNRITPALRSELCAAAEALALGSQPSLLDAAVTLVTKTHELDPGDSESSTRLARLLAAQLVQRAAQPTAPKGDGLQRLVQQCEQVEDAKLDNGTIDALHAECLLAQDSRDRQQMLDLVQHAQPVDAYTQFVQARVLRAMPQPDWNQITNLLSAAYADSGKLPATVAAPFRRSAAAKLLVEAAARQRAPPPSAPAAVLASPFVSAAAADEAYKQLQLARVLSSDIDTADLKLNDAQQRDLLLNLALAAGWKPKPDDALAKSLSDALAKLNDTELGPNAFPALLLVFRSHQQPADQAIGLQAARRIVELFQKQFPVADPEAVKLFKEVMEPALAMADAQVAGELPPSDVDKVYASAADFISHYQRATWPFADKQVELEQLLTKAIVRNPKVAKYYTSRGVVRVSQAPPNIDGALADAAGASKIDPNLPAAFALQGHALIYRSRQEPTRQARLADLDQALAMSNKSVEKSKADDKDRSMHLLYVSMAHLEMANFETDPKIRKEHLLKAVAAAQQAIELEKAYPDYAYVALGNALEDLAWLVGDEPEKNFTAAIDAFSHAIDSNLAAAGPWIGRARCFYKAVADVKLDPKFLGRTSEEALQAAISDLEQAKQLQPNLVEPYLWLGKANQQLGKFAEADAALGDAVRMAEEQKLRERGMYLIEWARNPMLNPALSADERSKLVRERAEKLKAAPDVGGTSSAKQATLLIGEVLMGEKKFPEAIKEYDSALADYDKLPADKPLDPNKSDGADVSLLLARAYGRLNLPETQWNLPAAEGVFKDAARIAQLKPGPHFEALASWYAANAKSRSLKSTSPTITAEKKKEFFDTALADVKKAIDAAPNDPGSYEWRTFGAKLLAAKLQVAPANTPPETIKSLGTQARQWIDEAIAQVAKRPDLSDQMDALQRVRQQLDTLLTAKGVPRT